jgi:hypothetical protein
MGVYTSSILIDAAPDAVFDFASRPENQPSWATNFVRSTRPLGGGRHVMETPAGELTYRVRTDTASGVIDFVLETPAGESILPARVVPHGGGSIFTFTITRAPGMSPEAWEHGKRGLDEELENLKALMEK